MFVGADYAALFAGIAVGTAGGLLLLRNRRALGPQPVMEPAAIPHPSDLMEKRKVSVTRPHTGTIEGLEIRYDPQGLVRAVRVGAMNAEHKELLLTMDDVQWHRLPNAHKQEVLAAARSTWAAKMCERGPDIAYVVIKTERGEIVGRADPHSVTVL